MGNELYLSKRVELESYYEMVLELANISESPSPYGSSTTYFIGLMAKQLASQMYEFISNKNTYLMADREINYSLANIDKADRQAICAALSEAGNQELLDRIRDIPYFLCNERLLSQKVGIIQ